MAGRQCEMHERAMIDARLLWSGGNCDKMELRYSAVSRNPMASPTSFASPQRFIGHDWPYWQCYRKPRKREMMCMGGVAG